MVGPILRQWVAMIVKSCPVMPCGSEIFWGLINLNFIKMLKNLKCYKIDKDWLYWRAVHWQAVEINRIQIRRIVFDIKDFQKVLYVLTKILHIKLVFRCIFIPRISLQHFRFVWLPVLLLMLYQIAMSVSIAEEIQ